MTKKLNQEQQLNKHAVTGSVDLFNQIYNFIESIRQTTMNKETYDEALDILKKMINEKI